MLNREEVIIKMAAEAGAKAALETLEREEKKKQKRIHDKKLHNTKLLLKNYRIFKTHSKYAIYTAAQCTENAVDILSLMWDRNNRSEQIIDSIKNSAIRTKIIMTHIDEMLNVYKLLCEKSGKCEDLRRYRILVSMYIKDNPKTIEGISDTENIDIRTVYKDINIACEKMASLIFGVDWLY